MNFDETVEILIKKGKENDCFVNVDEILEYYRRDSLEFSQIKNKLEENKISIIDIYESCKDDLIVSDNKSSLQLSVVKLYLKEIGPIPILSKEEELSLFKMYNNSLLAKEKILNIDDQLLKEKYLKIIADGDLAKERLINSNLKLVVSIAKRYQNLGLDLQDLIQEGNDGLMKAVEKFECEKGTRLSTYATSWIIQAINRAIDNKSRTIRKPVHICDAIKKYSNIKNKLSQKLSREAKIEEVAKELGISEDKAYEIETFMQEPISLQQKCSFDDNTLLEDFIPDKESFSPMKFACNEALTSDITKVLNDFSNGEKNIINLRFGLNGNKKYTLSEIALMMNTSTERIRQIQGKILKKIKDGYPELYSYWLEI